MWSWEVNSGSLEERRRLHRNILTSYDKFNNLLRVFEVLYEKDTVNGQRNVESKAEKRHLCKYIWQMLVQAMTIRESHAEDFVEKVMFKFMLQNTVLNTFTDGTVYYLQILF